MAHREPYLHIDGERIGRRTRRTAPVLNPATGGMQTNAEHVFGFRAG